MSRSARDHFHQALHFSETDRQVRDEIGQQSVMQQLHIRLDQPSSQ